jgi:hypothetical protein
VVQAGVGWTSGGVEQRTTHLQLRRPETGSDHESSELCGYRL